MTAGHTLRSTACSSNVPWSVLMLSFGPMEDTAEMFLQPVWHHHILKASRSKEFTAEDTCGKANTVAWPPLIADLISDWQSIYRSNVRSLIPHQLWPLSPQHTVGTRPFSNWLKWIKKRNNLRKKNSESLSGQRKMLKSKTSNVWLFFLVSAVL